MDSEPDSEGGADKIKTDNSGIDSIPADSDNVEFETASDENVMVETQNDRGEVVVELSLTNSDISDGKDASFEENSISAKEQTETKVSNEISAKPERDLTEEITVNTEPYLSVSNDSKEKDDDNKGIDEDTSTKFEQALPDSNEIGEKENETAGDKQISAKSEQVINESQKKKTDDDFPNKVPPTTPPVQMQLVLMPQRSGSGETIEYTPVFVIPEQISADKTHTQTPMSQTSLGASIQFQNVSANSVSNKTDVPVAVPKSVHSIPKASPTVKPQVLIRPKVTQSGKPLQNSVPSMMMGSSGTAIKTPVTQSGIQKPGPVNAFNQYLVVTDMAKSTDVATQPPSGGNKVAGVILQNKVTGAVYTDESVQKMFADGKDALLKKVLGNTGSTAAPKQKINTVGIPKQSSREIRTVQSQKQSTSEANKNLVIKYKKVKANDKKIVAVFDHAPVKISPNKKKTLSVKTKSWSREPKDDSTNMKADTLHRKKHESSSSNKKQDSLPNKKVENSPTKKQDTSPNKKSEIIINNIQDNLPITTPDQLFVFPNTKDPTPDQLFVFPNTNDPEAECICCGRKILVVDLNTEDMHRKGFPDLLYRYGGITVDEEHDKICQPCINSVIKIDTKLIKFFERCQKQAKKRGKKKIPLIHIKKVLNKTDKSTNTDFTALISVPVIRPQTQSTLSTGSRNHNNLSKTAPGKFILPKPSGIETNKAEVINNMTTLIPGHFVSSKTNDMVKRKDQVVSKSDVVTSEQQILPKPGDTASNSIQKLVQHETVLIDHDYHQSVHDKQRTDLVKKVELEELKAKLYSDKEVNGVWAPYYTIVKCCGQRVKVRELAQKLLSSEEAVNKFQAQELKKNSETARGLMVRKGNTSDLMKKNQDDNILTYDFTKLYVEFCENFPFLAKSFLAITNIPAEKLEHFIPHFGMIYATLMRMRFNELNRVHRMVTRCLLENLATKRVSSNRETDKKTSDEFCDWVRHKPACSCTEAYGLWI